MTTAPRSRVSNRLAIGVSAALALAAGPDVSAHRLDEYLQAARIDLQPAGVRIELDLTPGAAVAESIIGMIDRDRDGALSAQEQDTYASELIAALEITVDGVAIPLRMQPPTFASLADLRRGQGTIRVAAIASHRTLSAGPHELFFRNRHLAVQSVYLANALVPESDDLAITSQRRDRVQSELTIDYSVADPAARLTSSALMLAAVAAVLLARFTRRKVTAAA